MMKVRARGGIVVVVAHRRSALASVDQVLAMAQGRLQMVGPKDEVLSKLFSRQQAAATAPPGVASAASAPLRLVGDSQGTSS
jgi:ABC-type protease/lipase transport system fused ATPase/permease subunit